MWLMTIRDRHELCSLPTRMSHSKSSLYFVKEFKTKNVLTLSDHVREFKNESFQRFCEEHGIPHNFSCPREPQHNGVVERKNKSLQEIARTMSNDFNSPIIYIRPILKKTDELWKGRQPNISYFHPFGWECFILNTKDNLGNFYPKSKKGTFLRYSNASKAYKMYNSRTLTIDESIHVIFNDYKLDKELSKLNDYFAYFNFEDLQMLSKEFGLDEDPKEDKSEPSSRNWKMKTTI
ncbi:hypothetical protein CR513_13195, partial [Mucuna pruriens]